MRKSKSATLSAATPATKASAPSPGAPARTTAVAASLPSSPPRHTPDRFTYALKSYTGERRSDGWWIARTPVGVAGEKPSWEGPFAAIEDACLAIARHLATEIANRHSVQIGFCKLKPGDPLYGLRPITRLETQSARKRPA